MREVFLLRHGEAEPHAESDSARRLTANGREQVARTTRGMVRTGISVDLIWHSPYVRATETAHIAASAFGCSLREDARITPSGEPVSVAAAIRAEPTRRLLVVSHLPFLPRLTSTLLDAELRLDLGTSGLIMLSLLGPGPAYLRATIPNEVWEQAN